jgi:drug/metabolite transporter (DMT)-like permease
VRSDILTSSTLPDTTSRPWLAYTSLVVAVLGITWSAVFVRWAGVSGPASAFYRVLVAAAVLLPWRALRRDLAPPPRRAAWLAVAGGAFFGFDLLFFNTAVLRTSATTAVLLGNNAPVFVGLGAWLLFDKRPGAPFWWGLALALTGCAAIVLADARSTGIGPGDTPGDLMALTAAVFFAAYLTTTERVRAGMDTLTFSSLAVAGSVVTLLVMCVILKTPLAGYSMRSWASLAGLGLISQLTAYFAIVYALGHLPATIMSVGLLAQVPLSALLFVPVLGEPLTATQVGGGLLVLAGIYVVNRAPRRGTDRQRA